MPSLLSPLGLLGDYHGISIFKPPRHGNLEGNDLDSLDPPNVWKRFLCLKAEKHIFKYFSNIFNQTVFLWTIF